MKQRRYIYLQSTEPDGSISWVIPETVRQCKAIIGYIGIPKPPPNKNIKNQNLVKHKIYHMCVENQVPADIFTHLNNGTILLSLLSFINVTNVAARIKYDNLDNLKYGYKTSLDLSGQTYLKLQLKDSNGIPVKCLLECMIF